MHPNCRRLAEHFIRNYVPKTEGKMVLEVGSADVNGSVRDLFPGSDYVGVDVIKHKGVDVVLKKPYFYPYPSNHFDIVISTNCLEHCEKFWEAFKEMCRVVKPGGLICNIVPWRIHVHREGIPPKDCWRILDDGMNFLMVDNNLDVLECRIAEDDTIGVGRKRREQ